MKVLVMCQGGNSRSVGMAFLLKYKYDIDAITCSWQKNSPQTLNMLFNWADYIMIMESDFEKFIPDEFKSKLLFTDVGPDRWFSVSQDLVILCDQILSKINFFNLKGSTSQQLTNSNWGNVRNDLYGD